MSRDYYIDHNRKYDIKLYFNQGELGIKKIYGIEKMAQVFINLLMKKLSSLINYGAIDFQYLRITFSNMVKDTVALINKDYNDKRYPDEIIQRVEIVNLYIDKGILVATLKLTTKAGNEAPLGLGFPLYDRRDVNGKPIPSNNS